MARRGSVPCHAQHLWRLRRPWPQGDTQGAHAPCPPTTTGSAPTWAAPAGFAPVGSAIGSVMRARDT
ncbi:hypothetical protein FOA52_009658 [Chlamydomonas sp. UWO 241]|nr:hypothetical protein FOA52_009658 [Chlamydomonas sp. UWO 241]